MAKVQCEEVPGEHQGETVSFRQRPEEVKEEAMYNPDGAPGQCKHPEAGLCPACWRSMWLEQSEQGRVGRGEGRVCRALWTMGRTLAFALRYA